MTANEITKVAIQVLQERGCFVWRQNQIPVKGRAFIGLKGVPDIIGFHLNTGVFIGVEVKAGKDELRAEQIDFLTTLKASGGLAMIAIEVLGSVQLINFSHIKT